MAGGSLGGDSFGYLWYRPTPRRLGLHLILLGVLEMAFAWAHWASLGLVFVVLGSVVPAIAFRWDPDRRW